MSNLAISYTRFSSEKQKQGGSLIRQTEGAEAYAKANGLVLDRSLSFQDLGVSGYDKSNITKGALGLFLKAIEAGKVPVGATLIIENFDRMSRATPREALGIFLPIINAGLNVVTLNEPPRLFSKSSIDANMFQLFEALMDMHRAHEESKRKGGLMSKAWARKKLRAQEGAVMSVKAPHWIDVRVNQDVHIESVGRRTATLNPERAAICLRIVEMAERGTGNHTIIKTLHAENVEAWSNAGKWEPSYVQKMLTSVSLYGAIELDGEVYDNHYPAVIEYGRWLHLQALRSQRATTKNTNRKGKTVTNLFSGRLKCGYCGSPMNIAGYKSRVTGYERKYVACHAARIGSSACKIKMWFIDELEKPLLFWLTQIDYGKLMGTSGRTNLDEEKQQLTMLEQQVTDAKSRIERTMVAIEEGASSMVKRLHQHEADAVRLEKLAETQRKKIVGLATQEGGGASRMKGLVVLYRSLSQATSDTALRLVREQLSASIANTINKVTLYPAGRSVTGEKAERFAVVQFQNGVERVIEPEEI